MAAISAADVKRLREVTGVGMMDCKSALTEADGDFDAAIDLLRKKGQKVAAKRADRDAKEGLVITKASADGKTAVLVEVTSETDFVSRNEEFGAFANKIADAVLAHLPTDLDAANALPLGGGRTVGEASTDMTGKIGEKIGVRRFAVMTAATGRVITYTHPGSRLGVLVEAEGAGDVEAAARDAAMQVAALNPVSTARADVPEELRAKEFEVGREQARNEGKPEAMLDKIATGRVERYYKDNVLLEQPFVKDASTTVGDMLKKAGVDVKRFVRFALGD